jgi:hypothetical protein
MTRHNLLHKRQDIGSCNMFNSGSSCFFDKSAAGTHVLNSLPALACSSILLQLVVPDPAERLHNLPYSSSYTVPT